MSSLRPEIDLLHDLGKQFFRWKKLYVGDIETNDLNIKISNTETINVVDKLNELSDSISSNPEFSNFITNVNASMGGATNGTKANYTSTNYILANDSYNSAINKIDTKLLNLQNELDLAELALGLETNGTKTNFSSTNVITANVSFKAAIESLDTYIGNMEDGNGIIALQSEVDTIESSVGLNINGSYSAHTASNYLNSASSVKIALGTLDTQLKSVDNRLIIAEDDIADLQDAIANNISGVSAVNTKTGDVTLYTDDISEDGSPTNKWYTSQRVVDDVLVNNTNGSEQNKAPTVNAIKSYVDSKFEQAVQGLDFHAPCKTASNGSNINISSAPSSIGGYTFTTNGERVLLKDQTDATQNGIYDWNGVGIAMTRSSDSDDSPDGEVTGGMFTFIQEGNLAGTSWVLTSPSGSVSLGTDDLIFVQFAGGGVTYTGDNGININGTSISLDLNELTTETSLEASDKFAFADASVSGASKNTTLTSLATKLAGTGLTSSNGVISVNTSNNVTITGTQTISGDKTFSGTTNISGPISLGSSATATTQTSTDNSTKVATTAYVKSAITSLEATLGGNGTMIFKGNYDATAGTPSLTAAKKGHYYNVSVAGTLAGVTLNTTDQIIFVADVSGGTVVSTDFIIVDNTETPISAGSLPVVKIASSTQLQAGIYYVVDVNTNFAVTVPTKAMVSGKAGGIFYIRHRGTGTVVVNCTGTAEGEFLWYPGESLSPGSTFGVKSIALTRAGEYKFVATQIDGSGASFVQWDVTVNNHKALRTTDDLNEGSTNKYASATNVRSQLSATLPIVYTQGTGVISTTLTQYTDELAQDAINSMLTAGTHNGISYNYNDNTNSLSSTVSITGASIAWPTIILSTGTTTLSVGNYYYTPSNLQGSAFNLTPPSTGKNGDIIYVQNLGGNTISFGTTSYFYNGTFSGSGQTFTSTENDVFIFTRQGTGNVWLISKQTSHNRYSNEDAVDAVGAALVAGSNTGISFTYGSTQDSANRIDATVSLSSFSINALSDVDTVTTAPTNGQSLAWNGTNWIPATISGGNGSLPTIVSVTPISSNFSNTNTVIWTVNGNISLPNPNIASIGQILFIKNITQNNIVITTSTFMLEAPSGTFNLNGYYSSLGLVKYNNSQWMVL